MNTLVQEDPTLLEEALSVSEDEQAGVCMTRGVSSTLHLSTLS